MALLGSKKEKESETPPVAPLPAAKLPAAPAGPKMLSVLALKDGGLNGKCWRAGEMLSLTVEAADRLIADGAAKVVP